MPAWPLVRSHIARWWGDWNGAVLLGVVIVAASGLFTCSLRQRGPLSLPSPEIRQAVPSDDPYAKAVALARAGFVGDAIKEAELVLAADPSKSLPPEVRDLVLPDPDDPFATARAYARSGLDDKAREEVTKQIAARPKLELPPELRYLARPAEVFVDGRFDPAGAWARIPDPRTWMEVVLRDLALALIAVLLFFTLAWPFIARAVFTRFRIDPFVAGSEDGTIGKTIAALVEDNVQLQSEEGGGARLDLLHATDAEITLPTELKDLPFQLGWVPRLLSFLPSKLLVVSGTVHRRGDRGVGLTVALTKNGSMRQSTTVWEADFDPTYSPPPKEDEPAASTAAYQMLALAVAQWVLYQVTPDNSR